MSRTFVASSGSVAHLPLPMTFHKVPSRELSTVTERRVRVTLAAEPSGASGSVRRARVVRSARDCTCERTSGGPGRMMGSVPDVAPELDELLITIVVDNATDTLSSIGPGLPQLPELAAIFERVAPSRQHDGHDCVATFDHLCVACHGFSAVATARRGSQTSTALFDVGPSGGVWLANAEQLGVDLAAIDVLFLSHWHWDHSGGIPAVVAAV